MTLSSLIRTRREALDLSLSDLAGRSGLSKSKLWEIEDGKSRAVNITVATVRKLALGLKVSPLRVFRAALGE